MSKPTVQAFTPEVKLLILHRQRSQCAVCGLKVRDTGQFHHRRPRGIGGGKDPLVGSPANGILVHPGCHQQIENRREWAKAYGWLLRFTDTPSKVKVMMAGMWALLDDDGGMTIFAEKGEP